MKNVAVIGLGAAGLCALRHLTARPNLFRAVGFEQSSQVGGTWVYTPDVHTDKNGITIHSSMYQNLRTNLPKEVMAFPDFNFQKSLPSFIEHHHVKDYLQDYANHFDLMKHAKLETQIQHVEPRRSANAGSVGWRITYKKVQPSAVVAETEDFDAIIVCNGHYSVPNIPNCLGLDSFKGNTMHSHDYRSPKSFTGKTILCLGAGASGIDIALDLSTVAKKVYLSHNKAKLTSELPPNLIQTAGIDHFSEKIVHLKDGSEVEVDSVMFCTGYKYTFPFLKQFSDLKIFDGRVYPLFKHIVHVSAPSLNFVGIANKICPFPTFHCQVQFILAHIDGSMKLPTKEQMLKDIEKDYVSRKMKGMPPRHAHMMVGQMQWDYNDDITTLAKIPPISTAVRSLFDKIHYTRTENLLTYKNYNYDITNNSYTEISQ